MITAHKKNHGSRISGTPRKWDKTNKKMHFQG